MDALSLTHNRRDPIKARIVLVSARNQRFLYLGWTIAVGAAAIIAANPRVLTLDQIAAWLICLVLSGAVLSTVRQADRLLWAGVGLLLPLIIALTQGSIAGLAVALFAGMVGVLIQNLWPRRFTPLPGELSPLQRLGLDWLLWLPTLLTLWAGTTLLDIALPLADLNTATTFQIALLLMLGTVMRFAVCLWLARSSSGVVSLEAVNYTSWLLLIDLVYTLVLPLAIMAWLPAPHWLWAVTALLLLLYFDQDRRTRSLQQQIAARLSETQRATDAVQRLSKTVFTAIETLESQATIKSTLQTAVEISGAQASAIFLGDSRGQPLRLAGARGWHERQQQTWMQVPSSHSAFSGLMQIVRRAEPHDSRAYPELAADGPFAQLIEVPLRSSNKPLGLLRLYFQQERVPTPAERDLLLHLGRQTGLLLDVLDWFGVMESYAYEMAQLAHLARISSSSLSLQDVLPDMFRILHQMVPVQRVTLVLIRASSGATPLMEMYGENTPPDTRRIDSVPELEQMRRQSRPRPQQHRSSDPHLSDAMKALIAEHGETLAIFPLISYYELLGLILLGDAEFKGQGDHEWQLLEMASNQIAAHLLNIRLYALTDAALHQRLDQLSILTTIAQQISTAIDPELILATMLEMAVRSTESSSGTMALLQENDETWELIQYTQDGVLQRARRAGKNAESLFSYVGRTRDALVLNDTRPSPFYLDNPHGYLSAAVVPLLSEDKVIGVLHMESVRLDFFAPEQVKFLITLARHAVISIENARLLEERQRQIIVLQQLQSLAMQLSSATQTPTVAADVLKAALKLLGGRAAALFRIDNDGRLLETLAEFSGDGDSLRAAPIFKSSTIAQRTAQTATIQVVPELRYTHNSIAHLFSAICVPIQRGGRVREVLCVAFDAPHVFVKRELDAITLLAVQAAGHLENATLYEYIQERNDRMRAILNSTRDGIILLDSAGRLADTNPSAKRLLGIDLDEYLGQNLVDVLLQQASTGEIEYAGYSRDEVTALARQLRTEPTRISRRQFTRMTAKQPLYIEEIGSPVIDSEGHISGRLLVLRDVTEQKLLADYRDEITHMLVHDLRGPLAAMISSLSLMQEERDIRRDDELMDKMLSLSMNSATNLMHMVDSLLNVARLEKREMPLHPEAIPIGELINEAAAALIPALEAANITLRLDIADNIPPPMIDREIIRRVLVNLIDNAVRFTPSGSEILVEAIKCPDYVQVRVSDSGPGIPPEERDRVFDRFRQAKANQPLRGTRGAGLGLTFCKLAVEAHGGRIWIEDGGPLPGACFAVALYYAAPS